MTWERQLWAIEFSSSDWEPFLIGSLWLRPMAKPQYEGEPYRALLFCTRKLARDWCRERMKEYENRPDPVRKWRFRPVRVWETVRKVGSCE